MVYLRTVVKMALPVIRRNRNENEPVSGSVHAADCAYTALNSRDGKKSDKNTPSLTLTIAK